MTDNFRTWLIKSIHRAKLVDNWSLIEVYEEVLEEYDKHGNKR